MSAHSPGTVGILSMPGGLVRFVEVILTFGWQVWRSSEIHFEPIEFTTKKSSPLQ